MSNKVTLKDAEQAHKAVVTSQQKQIAALYEKWADEMAAQAKKYASSKNPSAALKAQQITQLEGALRKAGEQTANAVNNSIKRSMVRAAQSVVDNNAEWMKKLGFPENGISVAFSSVPTEIVQNIITGQVYEGGWSLAKSIWSDSEDTLSKAYEMVAGGIAENKSVYDIAKDLEQFVSPSAKKPWNYTFESVDEVTGQKKTYRVYPKQVDYNAQRLARTLSQHAYQQTMVAVNKDNPFVQKIKWHSTGSRVCPICKARDGKVYPKDQVPMDHPNGMCILEPVYDGDVNQRLADWVNGKEDPSLDAYAKKFGFTSGDVTLPANEGSKVVQGNPDAIKTWKRREGKFDFEIEDAMDYQGFDGLPRLVDADEFDKLVKQSNFVAQRTYSAGSKEILDAYRDQLYHGKWYVDCSTGGAQYGQGMYCAADWGGKITEGIKAEMKHYQDLNRDRTLSVARADYMSRLTAKDVMDSPYMSGAKITDEEWKAYVKLKSDPNLTLYKLPAGERKLLEAIQDRDDWMSLDLAVSDMLEEFTQSYKGYSYTETLTLDPSAKVIKYNDLTKKKESEYYDYMDKEFSAFAKGKDEGCEAFFRVQTGRSQEGDFNKAFEWMSANPDEYKEAEELRKKVVVEAEEVRNQYLKMDSGSYAVLKGYDAINAEGHGESGSYTVILNRTKLVIKKG